MTQKLVISPLHISTRIEAENVWKLGFLLTLNRQAPGFYSVYVLVQWWCNLTDYSVNRHTFVNLNRLCQKSWIGPGRCLLLTCLSRHKSIWDPLLFFFAKFQKWKSNVTWWIAQQKYSRTKNAITTYSFHCIQLV